MDADTTLLKASARNMILGQLMTNDVLDERILQAMMDTPREQFVSANLRGAAYVDEDMEIAPGRYLMAPLTFAMLLGMTNIVPSSRVLVIGCLTGYAAAVAARLAKSVVAVDIDDAAIAETIRHMEQSGLNNVHPYKTESLAEGYGMSAPYDVIIICGSVESIPEALGAQLAEGGRLVTVRNVAVRPDSKAGLGKGLLVEKIDGELQYREQFDASSALLPGFEHTASFVF
jgi:protein-L-isoaspartate(D-aspartate) O-methyltransferase